MESPYNNCVQATAVSATALAKELIEDDPDGLEELHIHEFPDDESAI
jgi:hypothetical protein